MLGRGHDVSVVAAHPHYPEPRWGSTRKPYRTVIDGVPVVRLPLVVGRATGGARMRQEVSYAASLSLATPLLGQSDAIIAVSPSFPALVPAMAAARVRRIPWFLWLQDILPDGAIATGMLAPGVVLRLSRRLERAAYASASAVVVISEAHRENLLVKGVAASKLYRIYNPATQEMRLRAPRPYAQDRMTILTMGNIGVSQGLASLVRDFELSDALAAEGIRLVITGHGVAADEVRAEVRSERVEIPGLVSQERLSEELAVAALGLISQRDDITEFNLPSKLMNFMGKGIPVLASVAPGSEVSSLVSRADAGWVVPAGNGDALAEAVLEALRNPAERERRGAAGHAFAIREFAPAAMAERFEEMLDGVVGRRAS